MVKIRMFEGIEEVFGSSKNNNLQMKINCPVETIDQRG
jgi:hypothetical protein